MAKPELYISTDVETDGPIPGPHSMLSFASVAFNQHGQELSSFTRNLETLPLATAHPTTMEWWSRNPAAWAACRTDVVSAALAMQQYVTWLKTLPGQPVFVAYPAGFDFLFMYCYMMRFVGQSPFSHSALDIKTYAMAVLKKPYRDSVKRNMPKRWHSKAPHSHVALQDAREQGVLFINMLMENLGTPRVS